MKTLPVELHLKIIFYVPYYSLFNLAFTNIYLFHLVTSVIDYIPNIQDKIRTSCKQGNLFFLRYIELTQTAKFYKTIYRDPWPLNFAIEYNHPQIISYLLSHNSRAEVYSLQQACFYEDYPLINTLFLGHHVSPNNKTLLLCVKTGNIRLVKFFIEHGELFPKHSLTVAASQGYLDIMKFLMENNDLKANHHVVNTAVLHNHSDIVSYLNSKGYYESSPQSLRKKLKNYNFLS